MQGRAENTDRLEVVLGKLGRRGAARECVLPPCFVDALLGLGGALGGLCW